MVRSQTPDSKDNPRFRGSKVGACELITKERLGPGGPGLVSQIEGGKAYVPKKFDKDRTSNKCTEKIKSFRNVRLHYISNLEVQIREIYKVIVSNFKLT